VRDRLDVGCASECTLPGLLPPANRRIGIAIVIVGAALLPTVDPVSLVFETIPLLILYEGSIWAAVFFEKRWRERGLIGAPLIGTD